MNRAKLRQPAIRRAASPLAALEVVAFLMAGLALRGRYRAAIVGSWIAFDLNFLASGLAVIFVFTFKITRLI